MAETDTNTGNVMPSEGNVRLTHVIYGLHAFSAITGIVTAAFIVTAFLTGWPSIIAVIINYVKRSDVRGTYVDSHFGWQIRTFWFALLWVVIMVVLIMTFVGIPLAWLIGVVVGLWVLYRIARGWWRLADGKAMPLPQG
jgi:uncharacterized membrane protein